MRALVLTLVLTGLAHAGATVDIADPPGIYAQGIVTLDAPGTVRWTSRAIDTFYQPYVMSGECVIDLYVNSFTNQKTKIGFTCATPGQVHLTTTGTLFPAPGTATCPYDGAIVDFGGHLTMQLDGEVFYDELLWPNPRPCYLLPAVQATVSWNAPVVVFDNSTQVQPSLTSTIRVQDAAWNYSTHVFTYDAANMACASNLVNVGTRFKRVTKEIGFVCSASVQANSVATVMVQ